VTLQYLSIATIQRRILLSVTKPGLTTACSHCCQRSGWTSVKTTKSITTTQILARKFIGTTISHILPGWCTIPQLFGWGKTHHKQLGQVYLISPTQDPGFFIIEFVHVQRLECFVTIMYSKGCSAAGVIVAPIRHQLFAHGCKLPSILPRRTVPALIASAMTC